MSDENRPEQRSVGKRIIRAASAAEQNRHAEVRAAVAAERDEIAAWARSVAASPASQVAVGAVFTAAEAPVLEAIDAYAASHDLPGRSAVVREALAQLLDMPVAIPPKPNGS